MARYAQIASGASTNSSSLIVDTGSRVLGIILQNVGAVDIFVSEDRRILDKVDSANLPTVGFILSAAAAAQQLPFVIPAFKGKLWARSQNPGAALEVIGYEIC